MRIIATDSAIGLGNTTSRNVIDGLEYVGPLNTSDDIVKHKVTLNSGNQALPAEPGSGVTGYLCFPSIGIDKAIDR